MKNRKSRFITLLLSAAVTFGSLYAIAGPRHFNKQHCRAHHAHHCEANGADSTEKK
jgi:hypothetical protein